MSKKEQTHYQILGIKKSATIGEIKVAYRKLIGKTHPDKNGDAASEAWRINLAYHTLKDPKRRADYDKKLLAESLRAQTMAGVNLGEMADKVAVNLDNLAHKTADTAKVVGRQVVKNLKTLQKTTQQKLAKHTKTNAQKDTPMILQVLAWQAMLGEAVQFEYAGKTLKITLPQGVQAGAQFAICYDEGAPLVVEIAIINPDGMSDTQRQAWQALKQSYQTP